MDPTDRDISVFQVNRATGALTEVSGSPFPILFGANPFGTWGMLSVPGRILVPLWKGTGDVAVYDVDPTTGFVTEAPSSPTATGGDYVRTVAFGGGRVFGVNMQTDDVSVFDYDAGSGALTLTPASPFSVLGRQPIRGEYGGGRLFVTNTLADPITGNPAGIAVMDVDPSTGDLTHLPFSPLAFDNPAALRYVPATDRLVATKGVAGGSQIHVFDVDPSTGNLSAVPGSPFAPSGVGAFNVELAGGFLFVVHDSSNEVGVFSMDPVTGSLTEVTGSPFATGGGPWGVAFQDDRLFVTNRFVDTVSVFDVDPSTGFLTEVAASPFPSGGLDTTGIQSGQ